MLKFLLILAISFYILSKIGRLLFGFRVSSQQHNRQYHRKPTNGNVHIDNIPNKDKKGSSIKGGEYVDYEEVK